MLAFPASGQTTPSNDDDPDPVYIEEGEVAPFDGDLFPPIRSIRLTLRAQQCQERAALDLQRAARGFEVELTYEREKARIQQDADAERIRVLSEALEDARPWYESPPFVAAVSITATVGAVALATWIVGEIRGPFPQ